MTYGVNGYSGKPYEPREGRGKTAQSNRHIMRRALGGAPAPLVVNLRGRYVPVAKQVLHLADIHSGCKKQRGRHGTGRVGRMNIPLARGTGRAETSLAEPGNCSR